MIKYYEDKKIFKIDTLNSSYVFELLYDRYLIHLYYGEHIEDYDLDYLRDKNPRSASVWDSDIKPIFSLDTQMLEYPSYGTGNYGVSAFRCRDILGDDNLKLLYSSYEIRRGRGSLEGLPYGGEALHLEELIITLLDSASGIEAKLYYDVYRDYDIIARHTELITHNEGCTIKKLSSICCDFNPEEMDMLTLPGNYALERIEARAHIEKGLHVEASNRGMTSHNKNPFLILMDRDANNIYGNAYGFNLIYSGDFKLEVERNQFDNIRVNLGINDETFEWALKENDKFTTPEGIMCYSKNGIGGITRIMHKFIKACILPKEFAGKPKPVLVNTWEGSFFEIDAKKVKCYANYAKKIGADMVVLDDGWFGRRNDDTDGLGDWYLNKQKFPNGLDEVIEYINSLGLEFGIWVEPEMVNPKSDLFKNHPEWAIGSARRERMYSRSQYVLDLSNPEVCSYIKGFLDDILSKHNIKYIKWDMNRPLSEVYSSYTKNKGEVAHRYVLGLYDILAYINRKYPHLLIESCAGGGGRFDLGILSYSAYIWTSDNTSPFERALIQDGTSIAYPLECISAHVTTGMNGGNKLMTSLDFRYQVASMGVLGYELDFKRLAEGELLEIKNQIMGYKENRGLLMNGSLYRLLSPTNTRYYAFMVVSEDKAEAILKVNQLKGLCNQKDMIIKLQGLALDKLYSNNITDDILSGKCLMRAGLKLPELNGDGVGLTIMFKEEK